MGHTNFLLKPASRKAWFETEEWTQFANTAAKIVCCWYEQLDAERRTDALEDCGDCDTLAVLRILQSGRTIDEKLLHLSSLWIGVGAMRLFFGRGAPGVEPLELVTRMEGPFDTLRMVKTHASPVADPLVSALFEAASAVTGGSLITGSDGCEGASERETRTRALMESASRL